MSSMKIDLIPFQMLGFSFAVARNFRQLNDLEHGENGIGDGSVSYGMDDVYHIYMRSWIGTILGLDNEPLSLDIGRLATGYGIEIFSFVVPVFIAEIASKKLRGGLTTFNQGNLRRASSLKGLNQVLEKVSSTLVRSVIEALWIPSAFVLLVARLMLYAFINA